MTHVATGGRFMRTGFWVLQLGFLMSFGMVLHYVVGAQYPTGEQFLKNVTLWYACPWTLSTAVVLGGALGMMAVGAIYTILGKQTPAPRVEGIEKAALPLCTLALITMFLAGYIGYFVVDAWWPTFYYTPLTTGKNVWLFLQLACMVLYAVGLSLACHGLRRASHALA
jgi:hypothetical protein